MDISTEADSVPSPLDPLVCFALYSASHATSSAYRQLLAPWGLTYTQYLVLVLLWNGEPRTVGSLGGELGLDSGTLSPLIRRMEAAGMIERRRSAADDRVVEVSLADRGRELRIELAEIPRCVAEATRLSPTTAAALLATLGELTAGMKDVAVGIR